MKVYIDRDERWPDYSASTDHEWGTQAELSEDELADLRRVEKEYNDWQTKLGRLYRAND